jgi:hypothetical protein
MFWMFWMSGWDAPVAASQPAVTPAATGLATVTDPVTSLPTVS